MNKQNQIIKNQNVPKMLDCQYVSRVLFNRAEKYGYHALACIIASAFCVFLTGEITGLLLPVALDILTIAFGYLMRNCQSKAAQIRNYFDACVLGIKEENYTETDLRNINEIVYSTVSKKTIERNIQTTHTGRDNPPGVKDWYEFSKDYLDNEAVFECQRQNCWWNDALCKRRISITVIAFVLTAIIYCLVLHILQVGKLQSGVCIVGVIIGLMEQLVENYKYIRISKTMDDLIELPDISRNPAQLEYLQGLINNRRELLILEMNWIHKRNAKKWSEKYEEVSTH